MTSKSDIEIAQEIIGRSLFLFGAGATKDAGCLISSEMLDDIQKMDLSDPEKEALDFLLSALHYHSSWKNIKERKKPNESNGHQPNIEDLMLLIRRIIHRDSYLPYPITGSWADKINFLEIAWKDLNRTWSPEKSKTLFENLEEKLTARLSNWLNLGKEDTGYLIPISDYLKKSEEKGPTLEFFTLNYDLVFEKHFNRQDETLLNNGFTSGYFEGFVDKTSNTNHRINYYKLHGSINWEKEETGKIKESFFHTDNNRVFVRIDNDIVEEKEMEEFLSIPLGSAHIIFGQGGKFLTVDPFISLLYHFKQKLTQKDVFFVVGYSFFDPYINNMLLEGLSEESIHSKLMVVVNPQFKKENMLAVHEREREDWEDILKNRFIDHLQNIQKSTYLSDLPDFNLLEVSPQKIKIIPKYTKEFFLEYFSDGKGLSSLNEEIEQKEDDVF